MDLFLLKLGNLGACALAATAISSLRAFWVLAIRISAATLANHLPTAGLLLVLLIVVVIVIVIVILRRSMALFQLSTF
jgi:hypothetical protein